jgi:phosphoglycerol transferase MdoB-like AlkP superfamily enzyme
MKLSGWIWLIVGIIISLVSGYVYWFIPKDGKPNMAMAFFFFIGIIFILVGIIKLFFKSMSEKKSMMDSIEKPESEIAEKTIVINTPNAIDQAVNQMAQTQQTGSQIPTQTQQRAHTQSNTKHNNTFYKTHEYKGPVRSVPSTNTQNSPQQAHHATPHHVQNSEHGLKCKKCGDVNAGHANYCHKCGNRLK